MENEEKIYHTIKNAARKAEQQDFPAMDKVWQRVENQLDHKVLKKENHLWKKIAVAASVLLVVSVGYQLIRNDETSNTIPQKEVVMERAVEDFKVEPEKEAVVIEETVHPVIKKEASTILDRQVTAQQDVAVATESEATVNEPVVPVKAEEPVLAYETVQKASYADEDKKYETSLKAKKSMPITSSTAAPSVLHYSKGKETQEVSGRKSDPLLVVDGKSITNRDKRELLQKELSQLDDSAIESIIVLTEPLYIINGTAYSEEELFGANPTSPYAPLNDQDIKTTKILQGKEATSIYGEKGKKGVVIITTKNGEPAAKKSK